MQSKPVLVEPIDFEGFIAKNKTLIQNDPQRELLLYPSDDVTVSLGGRGGKREEIIATFALVLNRK